MFGSQILEHILMEIFKKHYFLLNFYLFILS